jgi:hypothetical protein
MNWSIIAFNTAPLRVADAAAGVVDNLILKGLDIPWNIDK